MKNIREIDWMVIENGCHICISHTFDKDGYPKICVNGKHWRIGRYVYTKKHGDIPSGLMIRHKCDNPNCINPEHLEVGTHTDNVNDKVSRGRQPKGEIHKNSKINESDVMEILLSKDIQVNIAKKYNINRSTVGRIRSGLAWKHITNAALAV